MAEFENPFADPEAQNLFHVSFVIVNLLTCLVILLIAICADVPHCTILLHCCCTATITLLWSPYGYRADHYIFMLSFFLLFFPRLISTAADWMSTILPHMVWP